MNKQRPRIDLGTALARYRAGRLTRREALSLLGALGVGITGAGLTGWNAGAKPMRAPQQEFLIGHGMHEGAPAATPQLGQRPDGTQLWRVKVGEFDPEQQIDAQAFFPTEITVNAGDAIFFDFGAGGFHTVTFANGAELPPLFVPDGATEATPAGEPRLVLNPDVAFPVGGNRVGAGYVNSGVDVLHEPGAAVTFTFPTPGTHDYVCLPHAAVMTGRVIVQEAGTPYPLDQAGYDALAADQLAAIVAEGTTEIATYGEAVATPRDDGTTLWEASAGAGPGQARIMRFLPQELAIKTGDTVRWVNRSPAEPHTVTFSGGTTLPKDFLVEPQEDGPPTLVVNPLVQLPTGGSAYSGEGYLNSGFFGEPFGPPTYEVTFDTPGTFGYVCVPHVPMGMAGSVTVAAR